jgi:hypothetical protein
MLDARCWMLDAGCSMLDARKKRKKERKKKGKKDTHLFTAKKRESGCAARETAQLFSPVLPPSND